MAIHGENVSTIFAMQTPNSFGRAGGKVGAVVELKTLLSLWITGGRKELVRFP